MRRGRQRLQVSTFPFLAVLLCAMGSLILLLLVIDRRAKAVASFKALQADAALKIKTNQLIAARTNEMAHKREALHNKLLIDQGLLLEKLRHINNESKNIEQAIDDEQIQMRNLAGRLQVETKRISSDKSLLGAHQAEMALIDKNLAASSQEMSQLTANLFELERAIAALKSARNQQSEIYSLVPYRGRHGENRRPLYVECAAAGIIFHPDHFLLNRLAMNATSVRAEVERRAASQTLDRNDKSPFNIYLFMLVRPDGLSAYYQMLAALDGLKVNFGYEFVESDWILDFPENNANPLETSTAQLEPPRSNAPRSLRRGPQTTSQNLAPQATAGINVGSTAQRRNGLSSMSPTAMEDQTGAALARSPFDPNPKSDLAIPSFDSGKSAGSNPADPGENFGRVASGRKSIASSVTDLNMSGQIAGHLGVPESRNNTNKTGDGANMVEGDDKSQGHPINGDLTTPLIGSGNPNNRKPAAPDLDLGTVSTEGVSNTQRASTPGALTPGFVGSGNATPGSPTATVHSSGNASPQASAKSDNPGEVDASDSPHSVLSGASSFNGISPKAKVASIPPRWPVAFGSRDWTISVECTANSLLLTSNGFQIPAQSLIGSQATENALLNAVRDLISRRQATVRQGELPYRPHIRFVVQPEGLRTYYIAYPALESLKLPMTRENVFPDKREKYN